MRADESEGKDAITNRLLHRTMAINAESTSVGILITIRSALMPHAHRPISGGLLSQARLQRSQRGKRVNRGNAIEIEVANFVDHAALSSREQTHLRGSPLVAPGMSQPRLA